MNSSIKSTGNIPLISIRDLLHADRYWVNQMMIQEWGSDAVIVHGTIYRPAELEGLIAEHDGVPVGLLTYHLQDNACEIVTLNSWQENSGIGTALIAAVKRMACKQVCQRLWLVTTNDNLHALRFYQKRGFSICAVRLNAIEASRKIKPEIPILGQNDIPIRDEIELELIVDGREGWE